MGERDDDPRAWNRQEIQEWQPLAGQLAQKILKAGFQEIGLKGSVLDAAVRRTWTWAPPRLHGLLSDLALSIIYLDDLGLLKPEARSYRATPKKKPKPPKPTNPF